MKDFSVTDEDKKDFKISKICRFCEKNIESDRVRDHCHLTGKYGGPALSKCNIKVTQEQSSFVPFKFNIFSNNDCHLLFKKLVDERNDKVKLVIIPKTNEEYI